MGRLELCCGDICTWIGRNFLRLNNDKTEVLLIGSSRQLKISMPGCMGGSCHDCSISNSEEPWSKEPKCLAWSHR